MPLRRVPHDVYVMESHPLAQHWRVTADSVRRYSPDFARFLEAVAEDRDVYEKEHHLEALTLVQAAKASGYTPDHISRLIAEGRIENVGKKGAPGTRRGDLPRKPKPAERTPRLDNGDPDVATEMLQRRGLMEL